MLTDKYSQKNWSYYCAIFLGSFLLFQIQPMISKAILPRFGGSYLVWTFCMLFFQSVLLAGYLWAHYMQQWFGMVRYARWHWLLVLLPLVIFPFNFEHLFGICWNMPFFIAVPFLLLLNVGLPFFVLSMGSIVLQNWFYVANLQGRKNPYVLYGASNLGSVLALLTYPLIFEPLFNLKQQGYIWCCGYFVLFGLYLLCMPKRVYADKYKLAHSIEKEPLYNLFSWLMLSAAGCVNLLAVTNVITFDIAAVPLLWVLPLSIYLSTFILTFKTNCWCPGWIKGLFRWAVSVGIILYVMSSLRFTLPVGLFLPLQLALLFIICINCHGRLVESKPKDINKLTLFYLMLAAGGFIGSFLVSIIAPLASKSLLEYPGSFLFSSLAIAMSFSKLKWCIIHQFKRVIVCVIIAVFCLTALPWMLNQIMHLPKLMILVLVVFPLFIILLYASRDNWLLVFVLFVVVVSLQWSEDLFMGITGVKKLRNFYGIYRIYDDNGQRYLQHGNVLHGRQYLRGHKTNIPLSYFHPTTPVGQLLIADTFKFKNLGMVGLGTGALAAYLGSGQSFVIYELDPDNRRIAEDFFSYLSFSRSRGAKLRFIFGDGRISLKEEANDIYDVLIIDAFNSGSIPVHLLTLEAIEEYFRVLKSDGLLLMHISNKVVDLLPVIYSAAEALNLYACHKDNAIDIHPDADFTLWVALTKDESKLQILLSEHKWQGGRSHSDISLRPWTDQYADLLGAMF